MPQLILTETAMQDYSDLVGYLAELGATRQAIEVGELLNQAFDHITQFPNASKMFDTSENIREFFVRYGRAGYSFLYTTDEVNNLITVLTIKHYRKDSYSEFS